MKKRTRHLPLTVLVVVAALGAARSQDAPQGLRLRDIRAQQPEEKAISSDLCRRANNAAQGWIVQHRPIDSRTLISDLRRLFEMSDEVILAGPSNWAALLSPSGEGVAPYYEVRVIRSWKGNHRADDFVTFGVPFGALPCEPRTQPQTSYFEILPEGTTALPSEPYAYVLFLRHSEGAEAQLVQGLIPAAGEGLQGAFLVSVPAATHDEPEKECHGNHWSVQRCEAYLQTSQNPVFAPYAKDPLAKKYAGIPAWAFLREVQSVASGREPAPKDPAN